MGMFDTVFIDCPWCGKENDEQTKAGECMLEDFRIGQSHLMDLASIDTYKCRHCSKMYEVALKQPPIVEVKKIHDDTG